MTEISRGSTQREPAPAMFRLIDALARAVAEDYLRSEAAPDNDRHDERAERVPLSAAGGVA